MLTQQQIIAAIHTYLFAGGTDEQKEWYANLQLIVNSWTRYGIGNPKPRALRSKPTPDEESSNDGTELRMETVEFRAKARGSKDKAKDKGFVDDTGVWDEVDAANLEVQLHMLDFDSTFSMSS